jgi:four helix bundle protein
MGKEMRFEDLDCWRNARELVNRVYVLTRDRELSKDFGLCSQMQRASVSLMTNIAEGFERTHLPEKLQFYNVARSSAGEIRSLLYVVTDNYVRLAPPTEKLQQDINVIGRLITGLIQSTQSRQTRIASISKLQSSNC